MAHPTLTPEDIQHRIDVLAECEGNKAEAARRLGISRDALSSSISRAADARKCQAASASAETRRLERRIAELTEQLEQARKARGLVLPERGRKARRPKTFARLILTDSHGSHADPDAVGAMLSDIEHVDIREIVHLGDALECGGFLAEHRTLGYVAQIDEASYEDDIAAANDLLDRLARACPKAQIHYIEGNHEHRIERWAVDKGVTAANADFILRQLGPERVLRLADRGVRYYRQGARHGDVAVPGVVKIGKTYFTHGGLTRKHAAAGQVERFAGCVMYGHTHRADYTPTRMVSTGLVAAWCPGCLSNLQPKWHHADPTTWTHGYILQIVDSRSGDFQVIQVPIQHGRSYLHSLLGAIS
jgi:predicted phosphodiesterase